MAIHWPFEALYVIDYRSGRSHPWLGATLQSTVRHRCPTVIWGRRSQACRRLLVAMASTMVDAHQSVF